MTRYSSTSHSQQLNTCILNNTALKCSICYAYFKNFQVTESIILFLKKEKEDNSMMKQEVSFDLMVELGPKHRSEISAIHSRADG